MYAPPMIRRVQSKRLTSLLLLMGLILITRNAQSQNLDNLVDYIHTCQTAECLDTIKTLDHQLYLNDIKTSQKLFRATLNRANQLNHTQIIPDIYGHIARMYYYMGEVDSSFYYRLEAVRQYEAMNEFGKAGIEYAELGYQYKRINLDKAFEYMRNGILWLQEARDSSGLANVYNNFGVLFEMKQSIDSALYYYEASLAYKESLNDSLGIPYSLENIALIQVMNKQFKLAENNLQKALDYRLKLNDKQGLLGNYINLAELYMNKNNYNVSIAYLNQALTMESEIGQPYAAQYCYEKLTEVYRRIGDYKRALDSHIRFTAIKDSLSNERNIKNVETLTIQYETEKKEKEIKLLSVENQLKEAEINNANNRFYASLGGIGLIMLTVFLLFNRYKHKQRATLAEEKALNQKVGFRSLIEGEEKERKRIAQELHDGLGQLLSTARLNVSAMEDGVGDVVTKQWENSIKLIDEAVNEVRHISHNMMPNALISIGFEAAIKEQIHIINDAGKVQVHADLPDDKINIPESEAIALYRVIQEVLNNALKYAEARNIWLKIEKNDSIHISIKDDGKGFDRNLIRNSNGIGWRNIKSRIEILNGELEIRSELGVGSEISMKLAI